MATAKGTQRFLERALAKGLLHPGNVRPLGPDLHVASVGFGGYRVGGGELEPMHALAIKAAMRTGMNLLDTSTHYAAPSRLDDGRTPGRSLNGDVKPHGASERLIGRVIHEACEAGETQRDELVVVTKIGHVARGEPPPPGAVAVGAGSLEGPAADDWHSLDPEFLKAEAHGSKERLGFAPDFMLLHNPEYLLTSRLLQRVPIADAWDEMYETLERAFVVLEDLCDEGTIASGYGVSSNFLSCMFSTTGRSNVYEALALGRVVDAASAAAKAKAKPRHRFQIAQLPLNAFENGAVLGRGEIVPEAAEGDCSLAAKLGVSVVTNRPINALPMPGVSSGDWGRNGASHLKLRESQPMGSTESLVKKVLVGAVGSSTLQSQSRSAPLQQLALHLAASSPSVTCSLIGASSERYLEDVAAVLRAEPLLFDQVLRAYGTVRAAAEELGCEHRGLW